MGDLLKTVQSHEQFVLVNGRALKNIHELVNALASITDEQYTHHVNPERNDFASWIHYVFHEPELAKQADKAGNKEELVRVLREALFSQQSPVKNSFVIGDVVHRTEKDEVDSAPKTESSQQDEPPPPPVDTTPVETTPTESESTPVQQIQPSNNDILQRLDELLLREKEIEFKEKKILEIEEEIEHRIASQQGDKFFSREFIQGIVAGFLITLILVLIYVKFVVGASL